MRRRIQSLVMTAAMILTLMQGMTAFAEDRGEAGEPALDASSVITAFDALPENVAEQSVMTGTAPGDLNLPDKLSVELGGVPGSVQVVSWQAMPAYDAVIAGTYVFTPEIPGEYSMDAGVTPPEIAVTVYSEDSRITGEAAVVIFIVDSEDPLYLTEGVEVTEADLLAGVSAEDENGDRVEVTIQDIGSLDLQNPARPDGPVFPATPYIITYAAEHPVTGEVFTETREAYVTAGAMAFLAANEETVTISNGSAYTYEERIQNAIYKVSDAGGGTVNVNGTRTTSGQFELTIPSNVMVKWSAKLSCSHNGDLVILIIQSGGGTCGTFEVVDGFVENTGTGSAVTVIGTVATATVSGGSVIGGSGCHAINAWGANATVNVSGGEVKATANGVAINAIGANATVNVSGGVVSAPDIGGTAIYAKGAGSSVTVSGGMVSATTGNAIFAYGSVAVSGDGTVSSATGCAIVSDSIVTVSDRGTVYATGYGGCAIYTYRDVEIKGGTVSGTADGSNAITAVRTVGTSPTVKVSGGVVSATTGIAIYATDASVAITVSGGIVYAIADGGTAILTSGNVNITGGTVSAITTGTAIFAYGNVNITGGTVSAGSGYGINAADTSSTVTVSDNGNVYATANGGSAIRSLGNVIITGGTVTGTADGSKAISAEGDATVTVRDGVVSATTGNAIYATTSRVAITVSGGVVSATGNGGHAILTSGDVKITGGTVSAVTNGAAIYTTGASSAVTVSGGTVSATTGHAIYAMGTSSAVTVSGGFVFAWGSGISGVVYNTAFSDPTGDGIVVAWDTTSGRGSFIKGTATDLTVLPSATAAWQLNASSVAGISYANGENKGFFTISGVTVSKAQPTVSLDGANPSGLKGSVGAKTVTVTVAGSYDETIELTVKIVGISKESSLSGNGSVDFTFSADDLNALEIGNYPIIVSSPETTNNNAIESFEVGTLTVYGPGPAISGEASMTLPVGYSATSTSVFTITGDPEPTVTIASETGKITWNGTYKTLDIEAGLDVGDYTVVITADNDEDDCEFTFKLTVKAAPTLVLSASPESSLTLPGAITLTATLLGAYGGDSGREITFDVGGEQLGTAETDEYGVAIYSFENPAHGTYTFGASFAGDEQNYPATATQISGYTVSLGDRTDFAIENPGVKTYGDNGFTLKTSVEQGTGDVSFSVPDNNGVLTVTSDGAVTIIGKGSVTVTAIKAANNTYNQATATLSITVEPRNIDNVTVSVTGDRVYTGSRLQPVFTVSDGDIAITSDDYTGTYGENIDAGTYGGSITLTGQGNYTGEKTVAFDIEPLSLADAVITLAAGPYINTGVAVEPDVTSVVARGVTVPASEYDVSYSNNIGTGTATVTVTAKANTNFIGSAGADFTIEVDFTALDAKIVEAKAIQRRSYTTTTWNALQTAIISAETVRQTPDVTQAAVDAEIAALTSAIAGLRSSGSTGSSTTTPSRSTTTIDDTPTPLTGGNDASGLPFTDVPVNAWYYNYVLRVYNAGIMNGMTEDTFAPNRALSRVMFVAMLYRLEGSPPVSGSSRFSDVADGAWYSNAVIWAAENDIVEGIGDGLFASTADVTREQMVTIMYRYAVYKSYNVGTYDDLSRFTDADSVSGWAKQAMQWAVGSSLINGVSADKLSPTGTTTRAQAAAIFVRFMDSVK